jgi:hypothetical protein
VRIATHGLAWVIAIVAIAWLTPVVGASARAAAPTTLDVATAHTVAAAFAGDCGACQAGVSECARLSARRVDCVVAEDGTCSFVAATRLSRRGYLFYDVYPCQSQTPVTAAAQARVHPPGGQHFEPLTRAAFEFASDVYPRHLRFPAYPVRHYRGRTSQGVPVDLWTIRKHVLLTGSGVSFNAACWHGPAFLRLGAVRVAGGTTITSHRANATPDVPAHTLHARLVDHRRRVTGTLRLLRLACARTPIHFSARIVGHPGF